MKPSDNEIEMLAAGFAIHHKNGLIRFAHALLDKYAPQASAEPAHKPVMSVAEFCAEAGRLGLTADTLAGQLAQRPEFADCLPQADKDGGQQRNWVSDWSAAIKSLPMGRADAEGIRSPSNACMHRNECRAMLDRQQRAGDDFDIEAAAKTMAECMDYPWAHMPEQGREQMRLHAQSVIRAALSATQAEQGERDAKD